MIENGAHNVDFGADRFGFRDLAAINWNSRRAATL